MKRTAMLFLLVFALLVGGCAQTTQNSSAQNNQAKSDFPKKPIELIVPYPAGSSTDTIARAFERVINKYLPNGQSMVVVNKPGGSATIGLTEVFSAKPDGYKIGISTTSGVALQPHYGKTPYTHDSFQPIMRITAFPQVLVVKADAPWKTFEEWLDYVKQNPGKFTYGTAAVGNTQHIVMEKLNSAAGIQTKNVPFDASSASITALMGGHVQGAVAQADTTTPFIESGEIRALVNVGESKIESIKDVPLLAEKGFDFGYDVFVGFLAPKDLPKETLDILHDAFKKSLEDPIVIDQLKKFGVKAAYAGPDDLQKAFSEVFSTSGETLKQLGLIK